MTTEQLRKGQALSNMITEYGNHIESISRTPEKDIIWACERAAASIGIEDELRQAVRTFVLDYLHKRNADLVLQFNDL
jgi:hypothetical protein